MIIHKLLREADGAWVASMLENPSAWQIFELSSNYSNISNSLRLSVPAFTFLGWFWPWPFSKPLSCLVLLSSEQFATMEKSQRNNMCIYIYIYSLGICWTGPQKMTRSWVHERKMLGLKSQGFSNGIDLHPLHDFHHQLNGGFFGRSVPSQKPGAWNDGHSNAVINWGYTWVDHVLIAVRREDHRPKLQKAGDLQLGMAYSTIYIKKKAPRFLQLKSLLLADPI